MADLALLEIQGCVALGPDYTDNEHLQYSREYHKMLKNGTPFCKDKWAATWQNQQNECVPSEDSDEPGHPPSLIRIFAVRSTGS